MGPPVVARKPALPLPAASGTLRIGGRVDRNNGFGRPDCAGSAAADRDVRGGGNAVGNRCRC